MSTRARIGIMNANGSISSIYTHNDGYPSHHAPILLGHYNTPDKIRELLHLGNLSSLGKEIGQAHAFEDHSQPNWCTAYRRDRDEAGTSAQRSANHNALYAIAHDCDANYLYLFSQPEGGLAAKWYVCKLPAELHHNHDWADLTLTTKD